MIKKIDSVSDMNSNANNTAGTSVSGWILQYNYTVQ